MKRIRVMLGFLLMGAVVNTAVAWAPAYWWYAHGDEQSFWHVVSDEEFWLVDHDYGFGITRVAALRLFVQPDDLDDTAPVLRVDDLADALPWWTRMRSVVREAGLSGLEDFDTEYAYGWPVRSYHVCNYHDGWLGGWRTRSLRKQPTGGNVMQYQL